MKQKIKTKNLVLALALTSLVFILGIFIGNLFVSEKYNALTEMNSNIQIETSALELQFELIKDNPCKIKDLGYLQDKVQLLGDRLTYLEGLYGKGSTKIIPLKKQYSQIQLRYWMLSKHIQDKCNDNSTLILYFYSNTECDKCDKQGTILTAFKKSSSNEVKVYSFDSSIGDVLVKTLEEIYNITTVPSIVLNNKTYSGFMSLSEMRNLR